jgi:monoamine oxidase
MPHSLLGNAFKKAFGVAVKADADAQQRLQLHWQSRRRFVKNTALAGTGMVLAPALLNALPINKPAIVVVGAGIAGLNTVYQLQKMGYPATLYEAANRVGGRMFTLTNYFGESLSTDLGGEFIDGNHEDIHQLMKEMNLEYFDLRLDTAQKERLFFNNKAYTENDLVQALQPYIPRLAADVTALPNDITYINAAAFAHLDNLSVKEYLDEVGIHGWLYNYLDVMLSREYGMDITAQSAINFLFMLDKSGAFTEGHEIYKIKGGSQQLAKAVYQKIKPSVKLQHVLTGLKATSKGYQLLFKHRHTTSTVMADYVVMAIPFTVLKNIPLDVPMPAGKRKCINEFSIGNSAKFIMGVSHKPWRDDNQQGYTFADETFGCGWDSTHMQSNTTGSFSTYAGGMSANKILATAPTQLINEFKPGIDKVFTGSAAALTGKQVKICWAKQPYAKGGYTSFKKGQYSSIAGWEAEPVGNLFFAGEHVSGPFQGFMNGAAQTGRFAAEMIAATIAANKNK